MSDTNDGYGHSLDAQFAALRDQDGMLIGGVDGIRITADTPLDYSQYPHGEPWDFCPCAFGRPQDCEKAIRFG